MAGERTRAGVCLAVYLAGALVLPQLHRRHHERYGADHVHATDGTRYRLPVIDEAAHGFTAEAAHHAQFDTDLAALELTEVAHAGVAEVDCALAGYTGVVCDGSLGPDHAHTFGDELLAHHRHPTSSPPFEPEHGRGGLEHLGASLLAAQVYVLPPPVAPVVQLSLPPTPGSHQGRFLRPHDSRGPPLRSARFVS